MMRKPVFVDHTGRRRRVAIAVGSALGVLLVVGLVMLTAGLLSGTPVPLPGWPDTAQRGREEAVPTPRPSPSKVNKPGVTKPTQTATTTPRASATATRPGNGNGHGHGRPSKSPGKP